MVTGHLNINSIRNKFELLSFLIGGKVDILLISETKIDSTFPTSQFLMGVYSYIDSIEMIEEEGLCFLLKTILLHFLENIILIGDFNVEVSGSHMNSFCFIYHLKSLIKEPTYYKNPEKPTCIDLILI